MNGQTVIETQDLTKVYGEQTAVNRLTLKINQGEVFGFLGPNGAGKTNTLLMLLGLSEPTSGKARVCGFDPTREALKVKRVVGYLPENVGFYDDINAVQNLLFISRLNGIPDDEAQPKIEGLLKLVDLGPEPKKKVGEYSRGMRQRLGIAEVLLKNPQVVFLDEPTLGLDPDGSHQMLYCFVLSWGEFLFARTLINSPNKGTITAGVTTYIGDMNISWNDMMAASLLACLPVLLIFFFLEKHIVRGLVSGSIK